MELKLIRKYKKDNYTIGHLYVNGVWFSNTLEDKDRSLNSNMYVEDIKRIKVPNETAIPTGKYEIDMNTVSNRFGSKTFYKNYANNGRLPKLKNIKGFEGVLIHCGNTNKDTSGCVLVGLNKIKGGLTDSQDTFKRLYPILDKANRKGEKITIEII